MGDASLRGKGLVSVVRRLSLSLLSSRCSQTTPPRVHLALFSAWLPFIFYPPYLRPILHDNPARVCRAQARHLPAFNDSCDECFCIPYCSQSCGVGDFDDDFCNESQLRFLTADPTRLKLQRRSLRLYGPRGCNRPVLYCYSRAAIQRTERGGILSGVGGM